LTANIDKTFQEKIHEKTKTLIAELENKAIEREVLARLLVLTIVSESHMFLIGEPGVAKTYLIKKVRHAVRNGRFFEYLMSQSTQAKEILGVPYEGDNGQILYNIKDSIVDSHFVFLDEGFKAPSAINNALLGIASNERTFHMRGTGRGPVKTDVRSLFFASNEFPEDSVLDAFDDRLHIRYQPLRIRKHENYKRFIRGDFDKSNKFSVSFTIEELDAIVSMAENVKISEYIEEVIIAIKELFVKQRIKMSDRKISNAINIMKVSAFCNGRTELDLSDVLLFMHIGWRNFDDRDRVKEICYDTLFKSKNYFEAEIEKFEQLSIQQINFAKNDLEPILQKQIKLDASSISRELARYRPPIKKTYENMMLLDKKIQEILEYFKTIKSIEDLTRNNIFHIDLLKEDEMLIPKPYTRSFDDDMISKCEAIMVSLRKTGNILKEFLDTCIDIQSYLEYTPKKIR